MNFRIEGLPPDAFQPFFSLDDEALAARGALRRTADHKPGFPCRVSLEDAGVGEPVLLLHYEHHSVSTPYRSGHAIYVRECARQALPQTNEVPQLLRLRLLSVRAFDGDGMMLDADVVEGRELEPVLGRLLALEGAAYLHLHNAKPGCYAARVERV
jgi:hypothetical protein